MKRPLHLIIMVGTLIPILDSIGCVDSDDQPLDEASDAGSGDSSNNTTVASGSDEPADDPFAACERAVLESDLSAIDPSGQPVPVRWFGPGADPESGALALDPEATYFASATYLALQPSDAALGEFSALQPALSEALMNNPGVVALQLGFSTDCVVARTFTVWSDESAMMTFVLSDAHIEAVRAFPRLSRGGSTLATWTAGPGEDLSWSAALQHLASEAAYD